MLRIIIGIVVGMIVGVLVILGFQMLDIALFPLPQGATYTDPASMKDYVSALPLEAFVILLAGYAVGSLASGFVSRKISRHASKISPIVLGVLFSLGWVNSLVSIPHPLWVAIAGFFMYLPFTFLGHRFASD